MLKTFKAILKNNTLQWLDETPKINSEYPVNVYKYLSKINYTYLTTSCLLLFASCLSSLGN
ncbi:hypothetical protein MTo_04233 [Microcystis aeruginosa NIES-1211]|uniref:Uncharacterized protein n=1 Tax=Microcystis aeruginosa NIES-2519 TaxID=2303981 RepID=A0A5A5R2X0_MICAE|nr:hypothetical protein [Microcystis aeruginosa]AVQ74137.1 hypothetical protein B5D77_25135 [Microcystis sp. MC19]CCI31936.1 conserved hypothetical protein [Microcystis sp. T1-4]GBL16908.1 hypothetical protein MTo_04233 [Microcystis aeruginosa NIES-1211]GCA70524.1 hypothetical protein MiYa_02057 [Microcystis aeruginosa NIES-2519]GCA84935.1 hypothetical protein MiHa_02910 [Microcystis aeruginosa NIES-2522]